MFNLLSGFRPDDSNGGLRQISHQNIRDELVIVVLIYGITTRFTYNI